MLTLLHETQNVMCRNGDCPYATVAENGDKRKLGEEIYVPNHPLEIGLELNFFIQMALPIPPEKMIWLSMSYGKA